jgi:hypothetical protein
LAALYYLPSSTYLLLPGNAAFALRPSALRKVSGDAIMTTLGGARATTYSYNPPCSAHRHLSWAGAPTAPTLRSADPSLRPGAMPL